MKLESPDIQYYDPEPAVSLWNVSAKTKRRPNVASYKPRKVTPQSDDSDEWSPFEIESSEEDSVPE